MYLLFDAFLGWLPLNPWLSCSGTLIILQELFRPHLCLAQRKLEAFTISAAGYSMKNHEWFHGLTRKAAVKSQEYAVLYQQAQKEHQLAARSSLLHPVFAAQVAGNVGTALSPLTLHGPTGRQSLPWWNTGITLLKSKVLKFWCPQGAMVVT